MKTLLTLTLLALTIALGGCAKTTITFPDGSELTRTRFLHDEHIGPVSYDATDGSFTMDSYVGKQTEVLNAIRALLEVVK